MKKFNDALKTQFWSHPTTNADGSTLLTDKDAILEKWTEHFNCVLNRTSPVNDNAINRLPQIGCNVLLDEFPIVTETRKAIRHLYSGKAQGADAIPAEVYKAGGLPMAEKKQSCLNACGGKRLFHKTSRIIHLYKQKGNHLSVTTEASLSYQILERYWQVLLNLLNAHLYQTGLFPESQYGCRKD